MPVASRFRIPTTFPLCLAATLALAACTPEPKVLLAARADAIELVRLTGMDAGMVLAIARHFPSPSKGPVSEAVYACLVKADRSVVTNALALSLQQDMTPDDTAKALAFYRTAPAKKFVEMDNLNNANAYVSGAARAVPVLSEEETATVTAFVNSPLQDKLLAAGQKLGNNQDFDKLSYAVVQRCEKAAQ